MELKIRGRGGKKREEQREDRQEVNQLKGNESRS